MKGIGRRSHGILLPLTAVVLAAGALNLSGAAERPELGIRALDATRFTLSWTTTDPSFIVERAEDLEPPVVWQSVAQAPTRAGDVWSLTVTSAEHQQYFRLRSQAGVTRIAGTSPSDGETGVAVTRETIIRFSGPLAATTRVTSAQLHAEFGGRPLLSRIELAADGRAATLFYLENLPASARVRVTFDGGGVKDAQNRDVDADGDGRPGGVVAIDFETLSTTPLRGTAVIGRVFASSLVPGADNVTNVVNRPLSGVIITVDGMEQTLRTTTDFGGNFLLDPAPAGRFFVQVDGRKAAGSQWPDGAYYPVVGKAWDAVAGKRDNLAGGSGEIYLPLVSAGTLQVVSPTEPTRITFPSSVLQQNPALAGVAIDVPANALFKDDGTRGGRVGIAPVSPNRLPEPLPPGLKFPLVITVQTDGPSNFDRPVAVRFPNLPDPITGVLLAPGAKSALYSFNHDTGKWELQGPMTVSADGKFVESDLGVGIRQPGWHATSPITTSSGPAPALPATTHDPAVDAILNDFINQEANSSACAGDAATLAQDILNIADSVAILITVQSGVQQVRDAYVAGQITTATICAAITLLESQRAAVEDVLNRVRGNPPTSLDRVSGVLNCVSNVLNRLEMDCALLSAAPPSTVPPAVANTCDAIPRARAVMDILNQLGSFLVTFDLNDLYTQVGDIKNYIGCSVPSPNSLVVGELLSRLRPQAAVDPVLAQKLEKLAQTFASARTISSADWTFVGEFINQANDTFTAVAGPVPNAYLRLDHTGTVRRGRANAFGQYSFFMPADIYFSVSAFDPVTSRCGRSWARSADPGFPTDVHGPPMGACDPGDTDSDGLPDFAEGVVGTRADVADTDGDGVNDGAEIRQGLDPLDPVPPPLGVRISLGTSGRPEHISVANELAVVSEGSQGIELFNVFNGLNPFLVARVDTPTHASQAVVAGRFVAVADSVGLVILDMSDLSAVRPAHVVEAEMDGVTAVEVAGGVAYAVVNSAEIVSVDLATGTPAMRLQPSENFESIKGLAIEGDRLYALTERRLHVVRARGLLLQAEGAVEVTPGGSSLFVGGGIGYVAHQAGFDTIDLRNPSQPSVIARGAAFPEGLSAVAADGGGLGMAAGLSFRPQALTLDLSDPARTDAVKQTFETPGRILALAFHRGLAYLADESRRLDVLNYAPPDTAAVAPAVVLVPSFALNPAQAEASSDAAVVAAVTDDVSIRSVEFYLDGQRVWTDGSFPFQHHFRVLARPGAGSFKLRARALDHGGNEGWSPELAVNILADTTPPAVLGTVPREGFQVNDHLSAVKIAFSEPMDRSSLSASTVEITEAGPDGQHGTADDVRVSGVALEVLPGSPVATLRFSRGGLSTGRYSLLVRGAVRDTAGNLLGADFMASFFVRDFTAPAVKAASPASGAVISGDVTRIEFEVTEPLAGGGIALKHAGDDGYLGTSDDVMVPGAAAAFTPGDTRVEISLRTVLAPQHYQIDVDPETKDFAGNQLTKPELDFVVPFRTTIQGRAVLAAGAPAPNAAVTISGAGLSATTDADGRFMLPGVSLHPRLRPFATVALDAGAGSFLARSRAATLVHDGVTDLGTTTLQETCEPRFAEDRFPILGPELPPAAFAVFDDGSGPALYAGLNGQLATDGAASAYPVVKWTGQKWVAVGGRFTASFVTQPPTVYALAVHDDGRGPALYAGGSFQKIDGAEIGGIARWNGQTWAPVGGVVAGALFGAAAVVSAMTVHDDGGGPALFAAGSFARIGEVQASGIAKWNGSAWTPLGTGIDLPGGFGQSLVRALASYQGALYALGSFKKAGGIAVNNIASWNGAAWSALGSGLESFSQNPGEALAVYDGQLYAAGTFHSAGGVAVKNIARWNGSQWSAVGSGVSDFSNAINALAVLTINQQSTLFAAGPFEQVSGVRADGMARWDGAVWTALEPGSFVFARGIVTLLGSDLGPEPSLYVGGPLMSIATQQDGLPSRVLPAQHAARWNGQRWSALGVGLGGTVNALGAYGAPNAKSLYAGGDFLYAGPNQANHVARWNGDTWSPLGTGTDGPVAALAEFAGGGGNALYVGGDFASAGGVTVNGIARWDGAQWSALGTGLIHETRPNQFSVGDGNALKVFNDGSGEALYVGGFFNKAGNVPASAGVARWDGMAWSGVGSGSVVGGIVYALEVFNDGNGPALYAGGAIDLFVEGRRSSGVIKWNGSQWMPLGERSSLNAFITGLAAHDDGTGPALYAAGSFFQAEAGGPQLYGIAKWNGKDWLPLAEGPIPRLDGVRRIASFDDGTGAALYAGGSFSSFDNPRRLIARWDGNEWFPLDEGLGGRFLPSVQSLLVFDDGSGPALFFGGSFDGQGSKSRPVSHRLAKWFRPVPPCPPAP
jgi:hypothetical protein